MLRLISTNSVNLVKNVSRLHLSQYVSNHLVANLISRQFLTPQLPILYNSRNTSFFNRLPASEIWKGVVSVSNAGKKRGRGKGSGRIKIKNLNRGQMIGVGKANIVWPGLNAPIIRGKELIKQQQLPEDTEREEKLIKIRDEMSSMKRYKLSPLERGWSGGKWPGRKIGPPDPIGEDRFEDFETIALELKIVFCMKGNLGRTRRIACMVVTGNGKGQVGFAMGRSVEIPAALRKAKNRAGQKLMYFDLCNGHTIYHDFFAQFYKTKIYVEQRPEGYGLVCHRAIRSICQVLGIKDLYAKVEGSTCLQSVVKAFMIGLLKMKDHQQLAEEKKLHVVEYKPEYGNFPKVVASPTVCRKNEEVPSSEDLDFRRYGLDGKVILKKKKWPPFYAESKGYELYKIKREYLRNQDKVRLKMLAEHGEVRSFLTEKHPECRMIPQEARPID